MKTLFRKIIGLIVVSPFIVATKILSIFMGEDKAIDTIGPKLTKIAKSSLKHWVADIDNPQNFDQVATKMKKNFSIWKPFYDIEVSEETEDIFKLRVTNCPFCEALNKFGLSRLSAFVCEGDWAIAKDNEDKWIFERNHQIGTGNKYCDHTYKRIH